MATVRDYSSCPGIVQAVEDARDIIINCWEQWERVAEEEEATAGSDAWFEFMNSQIECVLYGMLDRLPDIREV